MNEKLGKKEMDQSLIKLVWEPPKLICLDKGKTEDGFITGVVEDYSFSDPDSGS